MKMKKIKLLEWTLFGGRDTRIIINFVLTGAAKSNTSTSDFQLLPMPKKYFEVHPGYNIILILLAHHFQLVPI